MRFLTLLKKELRECLPWMLLAAILLLFFGGFALRLQTFPQNLSYHYPVFQPGSEVSGHRLTMYPLLHSTGTWLLLTSIALGLALGVRQFWVNDFTRTWGFVLHRSVSRLTILGSKLFSAATAFIISLGSIWLVLYWYRWQLEVFAVPPTIRVFIEGWIFIALGPVVYLGTVLVVLSKAKWYTTKIFGLAFATLILVTTLVQSRLLVAFSSIVVGGVILLLQITHTFLNREF